MNWPLFLSVVLIAPVAAHSQQPSDTGNQKDRTVTLRACVQAGTHGSPGNLNQIEVKAPTGTPAGPRRIIYWFYQNVNGFKDHAGHLVEISGTVSEVIEGSPELKATDGVFAEIQVPKSGAASAANPIGDVAVAGTQPAKAVATAGSSGVDPTDDLPTTVVKAAVSNLKMLGSCS